MAVKELAAAEVRRVAGQEAFNFHTTADLPVPEGMYNQERARGALERALEVGSNAYLLGPRGLGRETLAREVAEKYVAEQDGVPRDVCYVYNFKDPRKPLAILLPAGRAAKFRSIMADFAQSLPQIIKTVIDSVGGAHVATVATLAEELRKEVEAAGCRLVGTDPETGEARLEPIPEKGWRRLLWGERKVPEALKERVREVFAKMSAEVAAGGGEIHEAVKKGLILHGVAQHLVPIYRALGDPVLPFLQDIPKFVQKHWMFLLKVADEGIGSPEEFEYLQAIAKVLEVNVIVDHGDDEHAPVVFVANPSRREILGKVAYSTASGGGMVTDHTQILPGALHEANGGVLIVDLSSLLVPVKDIRAAALDAYAALSEALRVGKIQLGLLEASASSTNTLEPQPIELDVRVFIIGEPRILSILLQADEEFKELFRISAQFETDMDWGDAGFEAYAGFVRARSAEVGTLPLDRGAVAALVEYGSRLAGSQERLTLEFGELDLLLQEASALAKLGGREAVTADDIHQALADARRRESYGEERIRRAQIDGTLVVEVDGKAVGQVNGLAVLTTASGYRFGSPSRITATAWAGRRGVVSIERDINASGPSHNKGVMILSGYLGMKYAQERPLSISASLTFEQMYGGVDGDSATVAELVALLSSLAEVPVRQNLAVTGSMDQHGMVQAVGGINEKVEGFFDVCRDRSLTGQQGVIIPAANVKNLMLRQDVVGAIRDGEFHVWAVETIDEAIELLTGRPAEEIHQLVQKKLDGWSKSEKEVEES